MINLYEKSHKDLENDYESQQLNEFYNQEDNKEKKEKLEKVRDNYRKQRIILKQREVINETRQF